MIGKIVVTAIILGIGAFFLLSDSFEEYIYLYADAATTDLENIKNDPVIQTKFEQTINIIYEKFTAIKYSLNNLLE